MSGTPKLAAAVRSVLKTKARSGSTTKSEAAILTLKRIEGAGGPTAFGIGAAAMRMALQHIVETEVTRQLKSGLTDYEREFVLPTDISEDFATVLGKIPAWIAIEEGPEALWMYWRKATRAHWITNAEMKMKKATQTIVKANVSRDIARFLSMSGFSTLDEMLSKGD